MNIRLILKKDICQFAFFDFQADTQPVMAVLVQDVFKFDCFHVAKILPIQR